ncbi:hypothetical protein CC79DRAFT_1332333 [Sarocladium strictum]
MAPQQKDMRRPDLIVPYMEPPAKEGEADMGSTISTTLPMAAMFMRNKFVGWAALVFSVQNWLGESEDSKKKAATSGIFSVGMSALALAVNYMPMFIPPVGKAKAA